MYMNDNVNGYSLSHFHTIPSSHLTFLRLSLPPFLHLCPYASLFLPPADIISTVEFNHTGELLATGDKGGRVVIFQREPEVQSHTHTPTLAHLHTQKHRFYFSCESSVECTLLPAATL